MDDSSRENEDRQDPPGATKHDEPQRTQPGSRTLKPARSRSAYLPRAARGPVGHGTLAATFRRLDIEPFTGSGQVLGIGVANPG